jgi:radical SAM/Cys-rich protein
MNNILSIADKLKPNLVDITGGAPEMNPNIKWFVEKLSKQGLNIQLRTNLTALLLDKSIIKFLAEKKVKLVASLPCYEAAEVDSVRGDGTFNDSIKALQMLNNIGYGITPELKLELVFNPETDFLPPPQASLEETYHKRLREDFGVFFTHLITIANMPVGRFKEDLVKKGLLGSYMELLKKTFNPETVDALMCRHQVNVNWDGNLYDCDFNLAVGFPMKLKHININDPNFETMELLKREIVYGEHCYGCTAGQGSSCSGALVE